MKLYQYDDLKKANQALGSFKRNGIPVINVSQTVVEGKVVHFVLTDPKINTDEAKEDGKKEKKVTAKKAEAKAKKVKADAKPEAKDESTDSK